MTYIDPKMNDGLGLSIISSKVGSALPDPSPQRSAGLRGAADKAESSMPAAAPNCMNDGEEGHVALAKEAKVLMPSSPSPDDASGHAICADKAFPPVPAASTHAETGQLVTAMQAIRSLPVSASLDKLAELQVRRKFYISVVNKQTNAVKALARRSLGWRYDEEEDDREKVNARAARIVAAALSGKEQKPEDEAIFVRLADDLAAVTKAISPCQNARHEIELEMKRIVRKLPIFAWAKSVHGLGELGLAVILAEAGDLSGYPKKGHLWKRLGLAPFEGHAYSTWRMKGGLNAEEWTAAGYSPRRRAEIYAVISEPLFRANTVAQGPYRAIYDRRRALTAETHPDWTKAHSHMDGLRVMTKYLLRDLWREWRRADDFLPDGALHQVPAA